MAGNLIKKEGRYLNLAVPAGIVSGGAVEVGAGLSGVALTTRSSSGYSAVDVGMAVYDLSVKGINDGGNSAVAVGDQIFINMDDTPVLSKKQTGEFFGFALEIVESAATTTINVLHIPKGGNFGQGSLENVIADPGTGEAIPVTASGSIAITTAAAETNTLAIPTFAGQMLCLTCDVYAVGARTITVAAAINQAANTTIALDTAGDNICLVGVQVAGALVWRVAWNDGATLSTP